MKSLKRIVNISLSFFTFCITSAAEEKSFHRTNAYVNSTTVEH